MAQNDDLVIKTLLEIKEDIGGLSSDMKSVKGSLEKNESDHEAAQTQIRKMEATVGLIPGHLKAVKDMETRLDERIGKIEIDVRALRDVEIPQLKDQLVVQKWLSSNRNKAITLVGVGLLGAAGNAAAGLVKDNVSVTLVRPEAPASVTPAVPSPMRDAVSSPKDATPDVDVTP